MSRWFVLEPSQLQEGRGFNGTILEGRPTFTRKKMVVLI